MKKIVKNFIVINSKKYPYSLRSIGENRSFVECDAAHIAQEFLNEDVPNLVYDLPNLILAEKEYKNKQSEVVRFRVSPQDKKRIEKEAFHKGYDSVSGYLRDLALGNT